MEPIMSLGTAFRLATTGCRVLNAMEREEKERKKAEEEAKMRERMSDAASIVRTQQQASASVFGFGKRSKYE